MKHCVLPIERSPAASKAWALSPLAAIFTQANLLENANAEDALLHVCERDQIIQPARIRSATEEDSDDLMPLFEAQSTNIAER